MKTTNEISERKTQLLVAGLLYLVVIVTGLFSEIGVRESLFNPSQISQSIQNWESSIALLRIGITSDMVMVLADIGLVWIFWVLFRKGFPELSLLAALFRIVQAGMIGANLYHLIQITLIPVDHLSPDLILNWVEAHRFGYLLTGIPFGLSCILLGYMMIQTSWFSKILGGMVLIAGIAYLIDSFAQTIAPANASWSEIMILCTAVISELSLCIYLLWKGLKKHR